MKKLILDALTDEFTQLQAERQQADGKLATLTGRLAKHRQGRHGQESIIRQLEKEMAETVGAGGDPGLLLKKIRARRDTLSDLRGVIELTEAAILTATDAQKHINAQLSALFQQGVITARNRIAERLQAQLDDTVGELDEWRAAVFEAADELLLPPPSAGLEIVLTGLR